MYFTDIVKKKKQDIGNNIVYRKLIYHLLKIFPFKINIIIDNINWKGFINIEVQIIYAYIIYIYSTVIYISLTVKLLVFHIKFVNSNKFF